VSHHQLVADVAKYYESKLALHGATPAGVDWNSESSQLLRFEQFLSLLGSDSDASIADYGCGYGALLEFLRGRGFTGTYTGFDASSAMTGAAERRYRSDSRARFTSDRAMLEPSDYTVASGIFNVRLLASDEEWRQHILDTIGDMASLSRRGFAFNALTSYSDTDRRRRDLYYADPRELFDHCMRRWPRRVTVQHDYDLYEFTLTIRIQGR
jgi:SAM-dependent methyltransferase